MGDGVALQCIMDQNGSELGWMIDAWRARCYGWESESVVPLPDYHQAPGRKRSRSDPSLRSIPDSEYQMMVNFLNCILSNDMIIDTMKESVKDSISSDQEMITDHVQLCWRISKSQFHDHVVTTEYQLTQSDIDQWCHRLIRNQFDRSQFISAFGDSYYYIPPNSAFMISDLSHLSLSSSILLDNDSSRYHLIMMDPPWDNKSAQRSRAYPTLRHSTLLTLPIGQLLDESNGIVAVWVTNDPKLRVLICDELFPKWNIQFYTVWYWIKLNLQQQIQISDLDSVHHKPYEQLIIGVSNHLQNGSSLLPKNRVFASFPESHSRKPVLHEIFNLYIPSDSRKLELFARDIQPRWTSWGNEPLKFQDSRRFQVVRAGKRKFADST